MRHYFLTDFLKNPNVIFLGGLGLLFEMILYHSFYHSLTILGMPYLTSIGLNYLFLTKKEKRTVVRVSNQYKSQ